MTPSAAEKRDWLRLWRTERVGPATFRHLLRRYGSARAALAALPDIARRGGGKSLAPAPVASIEAEVAGLARLGGTIVALGEPTYPAALATCEDAPPIVSVRGNAALLAKPMVAIVGARNASANGIRFARRLAEDLGQAGLVVVSGFARGIDTAAHQAALATGTVAAFAGGVDVIYPPENQRFADELFAKGAALSEMPLGAAPRAPQFPQRNRLVAGMSLGTVVVEAALKSGSLITARQAGERGREVFAVPGFPLDPRAQGCNHLIREGATLIQGADDVLAVLAPMMRRPVAEPAEPPQAPEAPSTPSETDVETARDHVLDLITSSPVPVDEIVRQCQLSTGAVITAILELELAGRLQRHPGNQVSSL